MADDKQLMAQVKQWILEAGEEVKRKLQDPLIVEQKSSRTDLVTNVDKETEAFLVEKIRSHYPADQILGEEGLGDKPETTDGRVWIIDPIDGTINFVKQRENFCIMIGIFEDGLGKLGFIYDVIKDEFVYGGSGTGVFLNGSPLKQIEDVPLSEGLVGVNGTMFVNNYMSTRNVGLASSGFRILGCAGLDFLHVFMSRQCAYVSNLAPWDFAAGMVIGHALGLRCSRLDGREADIIGERVPFVIATPSAYEEIQALVIAAG